MTSPMPSSGICLSAFIDKELVFFKKQLALLTTQMLEKDPMKTPQEEVSSKAKILIKHLSFVSWLSRYKFPHVFEGVSNTLHSMFILLVDNEVLWKQMGWAGAIIEAVARSSFLENKDEFDVFVEGMVLNGEIDQMITCCDKWCC
jgi:hypothetical protein